MPELIDGMTPQEFLQKVQLKRGRPPKDLQRKLDRARELLDEQREEALRKATDPEQIITRVERAFQILKSAAEQMVKPESNFIGLMVSGAPGIGKTYTLDQEVFGPAAEKGVIHYRKISGAIRPVQLMKVLHEYRSPSSLLLFDDNDAVFSEEVDSLNLLKSALDTTAVRRLSWLSSTSELEEDEKDFIFEGRVAFVTNIDLLHEIQKNNRMTPHLRALRSRVHYLDLGLHNKHAQALWTAKVVRRENILVKHYKVTPQQQEAVLKYLTANFDRMSDISIRAAIHLASYVHLVKDVEDADNWRQVAEAFGY